MLDLTTKYMGLTLKNPIIVGSAGLTDSLDKIKTLEANGAAAVVLKSIFEEQILMEGNHIKHEHAVHAEELDYIQYYTREHNLEEYLKLIKDAKNEVSIPIIASIHCNTASNWVSFAERIQKSGADALELNMFIMPSSCSQKTQEVEQVYFDIIDEVRKHVTIPVAVKLSFYFSSLCHMAFDLSVRKIQGIVLFNRFYRPDIDLDKMEVTSAEVFSTPRENALPLRWIGLLADHCKCDLVASTGIHDGKTIVKNLLAGAKAVQVVSTIYQNGPEHIKAMLNEIEEWMKAHKYTAVKDFIGKLSYNKANDPAKYERSQFMRYFSDMKA